MSPENNIETQTKLEPPSKIPLVALDLGEPDDWHIRTLLAQILGPVKHIVKILNKIKGF